MEHTTTIKIYGPYGEEVGPVGEIDVKIELTTNNGIHVCGVYMLAAKPRLGSDDVWINAGDWLYDLAESWAEEHAPDLVAMARIEASEIAADYKREDRRSAES